MWKLNDRLHSSVVRNHDEYDGDDLHLSKHLSNQVEFGFRHCYSSSSRCNLEPEKLLSKSNAK